MPTPGEPPGNPPAPPPSLSFWPQVTQSSHTCFTHWLSPCHSAGLAFNFSSAPRARPTTAAVPNSFHLPLSHSRITPLPQLMPCRRLRPPLFLGMTIPALLPEQSFGPPVSSSFPHSPGHTVLPSTKGSENIPHSTTHVGWSPCTCLGSETCTQVDKVYGCTPQAKRRDADVISYPQPLPE